MKNTVVIPNKSLRKFDILCLYNKSLHQDAVLRQQLIEWAQDMLIEDRKEWSNIRATTIKSVIEEDRKTQAQKRAKARDSKYALFREYFKRIQKEKFDEAVKNGGKLTANGFANWFLKNRENDMKIPYEEGNKLHKLIRLADSYPVVSSTSWMSGLNIITGITTANSAYAAANKKKLLTDDADIVITASFSPI